VVLISCQNETAILTTSAKPTLPNAVSLLKESEVQAIPLLGPASQDRAEISGMAWCGEELILLPQYPDRFEKDGTTSVFGITQVALEDYFSGANKDGIEPDLIPFDTGGMEQTLAGFEGFEAIVFNGTNFYVSIEARQADGMMGYLVKGTVASDCSQLVIDPDSLVSIPPQADIGNMSHETLVIYQNNLYVIYEANGVNVNPDPVAHVFDLSLEAHSTIDLPNIEYRITDATEPKESGVFWAINYFFPGDASDLEPAADQIALVYGVGVTHQESDPVERLLAFCIDKYGVQLVDQTPIYLELLDDDSRNWEGIVQFRDGFLLVTDKFPTTILAYVKIIGAN
jgi:hypothetical protein